MMSCGFDKSLLLDFALGEISLPDRVETRRHIARCEPCNAELKFHRSLSRDLEALPVPSFPAHLEEILVRSAVQVRRSIARGAHGELAIGRLRFSWTPVLCTAAGLAIVAVLVLILMPGSLVSPGGTQAPGVGGMGRGASVVSDVMRFVSNVQEGWSIARDFLGRLSPVGRAAGAVFEAIGLERWGILAFSVFAVVLLLWRFTKPGRKRSVGHVKARG
jgi:hypothetical protein